MGDRYAHADGSRECRPVAPLREGAEERGDVLALLDRRIANHAKVETNPGNGWQERAGWQRRELEIVRDVIAAGLHEGRAEVEAALSLPSEARSPAFEGETPASGQDAASATARPQVPRSEAEGEAPRTKPTDVGAEGQD